MKVVCLDFHINDSTINVPQGYYKLKYIPSMYFFNNGIPSYTKKLVLFVFDGCYSHRNDYIIKKTIEINIILLLFTYNSTHIDNPLDISVLKNSEAKHIIDQI